MCYRRAKNSSFNHLNFPAATFLLNSVFHFENSAKSLVNLVSLGATVMKYNQSPTAGFKVAVIASELGLEITYFFRSLLLR
jgi:hypothetical protein